MQGATRRLAAGLAASMLTVGAAFAAEFHATTDVAVMYDAPSVRAKPLFALGRDYPVETIVSVEGWMKVRDAAGTVAWIEKKLVGDKRVVVVRVPTADVLAAPESGAAPVFKAEQNVLLELADPAYKSSTPGWAKVRHRDGQVGFIRLQQVWGL